jgi:hypothetical protein
VILGTGTYALHSQHMQKSRGKDDINNRESQLIASASQKIAFSHSYLVCLKAMNASSILGHKPAKF